MNTNRSLITVLLLVLFSLAALRGINLLINGNNILDENTGTGPAKEVINPPRCIESKGTCSLNCKTGEKPVPASDCSKTICCVLITNSPTSPPSKPTATVPSTL